MAILKVARMGHPVLRQECTPIPLEAIKGPEVQRLIRDMFETMADYAGIGLAAPQVYEPVRLVIAGGETERGGRPKFRVLINPELTVRPGAGRMGMYEGCLSVPGLRGWVERPDKVNVKAFDENGTRLDFDVDGYPAIVIQHECDHLDGVLYVDRIEDKAKFGFEEEANRYLDLEDIE
jgi:peptide deformylase